MEANNTLVQVQIEGVGSRQVKPGTTLQELAKDCWPDSWRRILAAYVDNDLPRTDLSHQ